MSDITDDLMTTQAAADELQMSQRQIQRWLKTGELEGRKLHARTWLVLTSSVEAKKREKAEQLAKNK